MFGSNQMQNLLDSMSSDMKQDSKPKQASSIPNNVICDSTIKESFSFEEYHRSKQIHNVALSIPLEITRGKMLSALRDKLHTKCISLGLTKITNQLFDEWRFECYSRFTKDMVDPLIPSPKLNTESKSILRHVLNCGGDTEAAYEINEYINIQCKKIHQQLRRTQPNNSEKKIVFMEELTTKERMPQITLRYGKKSKEIINKLHYERVKSLYFNYAPTKFRKLTNFHRYLFVLLRRYSSLIGDYTQGAGYQAAIHDSVFDVLSKHFDVKLECFASPLNSHHSFYCSAFIDTDHYFGSIGSFFDFHPKEGSFEVNPPFNHETMQAMSGHITSLLSDKDNGALNFIVIVPQWTNDFAWKSLKDSSFTRYHLSLSQSSHGYCEGAQHMKVNSRYRISTCDTSVFFMSNAQGAQKWPVTKIAIKDIEKAFATRHKQSKSSGTSSTTLSEESSTVKQMKSKRKREAKIAEEARPRGFVDHASHDGDRRQGKKNRQR